LTEFLDPLAQDGGEVEKKFEALRQILFHSC
jgi:hypothetical protein